MEADGLTGAYGNAEAQALPSGTGSETTWQQDLQVRWVLLLRDRTWTTTALELIRGSTYLSILPAHFPVGVEETVVTLHFRDGGEEPQAGQDSWAGELAPTHCYQLSPGSSLPCSNPPASPSPPLNLLGSFTLGCQAHGTPFSYYDIHTANLNHVTENSIDLTVSCNT